MKVSNGFVIALLLLFTIGACGKERNDEISDVPELEGQVACELLNHFVGCWSDLISEWGNDAFILENWTQTEDSVLTLKFSDQMLVEIADLNWLRNTLIPKISISQENGSYYWNLDSQWIVNSSGGRCLVGDGFVPMFSVDSLGKWNLSTDDGNNWIPLANEQCAKGVDWLGKFGSIYGENSGVIIYETDMKDKVGGKKNDKSESDDDDAGF